MEIQFNIRIFGGVDNAVWTGNRSIKNNKKGIDNSLYKNKKAYALLNITNKV